MRTVRFGAREMHGPANGSVEDVSAGLAGISTCPFSTSLGTACIRSDAPKWRERDVFRHRARKMGVGVRHTLFPGGWTLGARPCGSAAISPTLFSTASGVHFGLAAGPVAGFRRHDLLSEAS